MYLDSFTLSALVVVGMAVATLYFVHRSAQRETSQRLKQMETRLQKLHTEPSIHNRKARELCAAIHHLYPNAVAGVDFQMGDDGEGPFIRTWMLGDPEPSTDQLKAVLSAHSEEWRKTDHREARLAEYPSIGDQLDALYKARRGDASELSALDERITQVKANHPNLRKC